MGILVVTSQNEELAIELTIKSELDHQTLGLLTIINYQTLIRSDSTTKHRHWNNESTENGGAGRSSQNPLRKVPRFPGRGSQARFPSKVPSQVPKQGKQGSQQVPKGSQAGSQARLPRTDSQARSPSKVFKNRFPRQVSKQGSPEKVSKDRFREQVCRNRFPRTSSQARLPIKGSQAKLPATDLQARCPGTGVQAKFLLSVYLKQLPNIIPTNSCWLFHIYIYNNNNNNKCCCWGYLLGFFFRGARFLRLKPSDGSTIGFSIVIGEQSQIMFETTSWKCAKPSIIFLRLRLCHASNQPK